jgi:hypothetical protein
MKKMSRMLGSLAAGMALSTSALAAAPQTVTDQLLALLLEKHLPTPLYEQGSNPWPGGAYSLTVHKAGRPEVTSTANNIHVKLPVRVAIAGNAGSEMLQIKLACSSSFTTTGEITFTPEKPGAVDTLKSSVTLPVPPVMANCEGMQFPIEEYLRSVINQNKRQWELKLDAEMREWLQGESAKAETPAQAKPAAKP